ncbi:hypothetical protein PUN28_012422 [Cardiocondyla obscurior]|uniref:Secreted protein n=1 Tax=Cardiocondyla obscurior TaxID=286306 RepID=A0AAW2FCQ6_9HYME
MMAALRTAIGRWVITRFSLSTPLSSTYPEIPAATVRGRFGGGQRHSSKEDSTSRTSRTSWEEDAQERATCTGGATPGLT